jgi:hypothetical protein
MATIGGNSPIDFTAIKLGNNSFLAQATVGKYKKGVFFEISNNNIKVTAARYCPLTKCQNRNLALTDSYAIVDSSGKRSTAKFTCTGRDSVNGCTISAYCSTAKFTCYFGNKVICIYQINIRNGNGLCRHKA